MFSRPKILFLVSLLFVALLNSIPTYLLNFYYFSSELWQLLSCCVNLYSIHRRTAGTSLVEINEGMIELLNKQVCMIHKMKILK